MKNILKWIMTLLYAFIAYLFIFGILVFKVHFEAPTEIHYDTADFTRVSSKPIYAHLVEERQFSFDVRLALIHQAVESIDISYYAIHEGESRDIFFGALLVAAERDVNVRFIIDGFIEGRGANDSEAMQTLANHPNITIAYYEIFDLKAPHAVQNRLHDKLIIVDGTYGLIGGRNIGDRYFLDYENVRNPNYDRDVLIFGDEIDAVLDMQSYFDYLFRHPYSSILDNQPTRLDKNTFLLQYYNYLFEESLDLDLLNNTLKKDAFIVSNATFLHSPLTRMQKSPVIFNALIDLSKNYDTILVQSPYIILSRPMRKLFEDLDFEDVTLITNNPYTNPNLLAVGGYLKIRQELAAQTTLYEYQGDLSLHTKTILMGEDISVIGSLNIDPRSAYLSTESIVIIYDQAFQNHLRETIDPYLDDSLILEADLNYQPGAIEPVHQSTWRSLKNIIARVLTYFFTEML